ncbi:hypothetical protein ACIO8G_01135 [Streptomyces sp. NPDC087219]|uniref:hypothetical protein n=1 Tax=Streptomyces sp. NPDC087219 TaxID=3365770 RepID=UPI00381780F8
MDSRAAADFACAEAAARGAELRVVHAWTPATGPADLTPLFLQHAECPVAVVGGEAVERPG